MSVYPSSYGLEPLAGDHRFENPENLMVRRQSRDRETYKHTNAGEVSKPTPPLRLSRAAALHGARPEKTGVLPPTTGSGAETSMPVATWYQIPSAFGWTF